MLLTLAMKGTLVLIVAFTVAFALRRGSAAMRHLVWAGAFVCLLMLPLLRAIAPVWRVAVPTPAMRALSVMYEESAPASAPPEEHERQFDLTIVWYAGVTLAMARLLVAFLRLRRLRMAARPAPWNRSPSPLVLESDQIDLPITFGILHPVIVFPRGAADWPAERLRLVLAHELAHVRRFDCLTQLLVEVVCAVYWFHPLVWLAASQSRKERERACDDAVLNQGTKSSDYAEHLLGIVRSVRIQGAPVPMAISIHSRDLQERLRAVLKPHVNRRAATPKLAAAIAVIALCIIVPIATMRAQAPESTGSLAGSILDPSRAAVPRAIITVSGLDSHNKEVAYSGEDGTYALHSLPAGRYVIEVRKPGFAVFEKQVTVAAGQSLQLNAGMEVGRVSENVDVTGQKPTSTTSTTPHTTPQRIPVGGNVQAVKLTYKVPPVYPEHAKQNGVQGVVVLQGVIGTDGSLLSLQVLSKSVDPELAQAARDAVSQWRYEPTLLNGQPVEVVTSITVNFHLE